MKKNAQITIFIILAIVLLVSIGTFFIIRTYFIEDLGGQGQEQQEVFIRDRSNMRSSIKTCLQSLAIDGLEIMSAQAGFIELPNTPSLVVKDRFEAKKVVDADIKRIEYDASYPGNTMPFWLTDRALLIPSKEIMESQLAAYISDNILRCVNNFDDFRQQGLNVVVGEHTVDVDFGPSVKITLDLPVFVRARDIEFQLDKVEYVIPVNMEKIYTLASNIAYGENDEAFLEYFATDIISKYSYFGGEKGSDDLPPFSFTDVNFDCKQTTWNIDEVERMLKANFFNNYKHVQLRNVDYKLPVGPDRNTLDGYVYTPFPGKFKDVEVNFFFDPEQFMYLDISPGGTTIRPDKTMSTSIPFVPMFCTYKYRFKYDLQYPIIVRVTDKASAKLDGETNQIQENSSFTFSFPLLVNICGNQKRECNYKDYSYNLSDLEPRFADHIDFSYVSDIKESDFCNSPNQYEELTIVVTDSSTGQPVENAQVGYYGGNANNDCLMGATDSEGKMTSRFPYCSGCLIYFAAVNYTTKYQRFDVDPVMQDEHFFTLDHHKDFKVQVKLVYLPAFLRFWNVPGRNLRTEPYETARSLGLDEDSIRDLLGKEPEQMTHSDLLTLFPVQLGVTDLKAGMRTVVSGNGPTDIAYISEIDDPHTSTSTVAPGTYSFTYTTVAPVTIAPSVYDTGDRTETVSIAPSGSGPYIGDWPLGSFDYLYSFSASEMSGKNSIVIFVPVDFMPSDLREVKDIDDTSIAPDGNFQLKLTEQTPPIIFSRDDVSPYFKPAFI